MDISTVQEILRQEILELDQSFVKESKKVRNYSGTTCLVAVVFRETLIVANVGDSRGVMATDKGRTVPLSFDHKPQQLKVGRRPDLTRGQPSFRAVGVNAVAAAAAASTLCRNDVRSGRLTLLNYASLGVASWSVTREHSAFYRRAH